MSAPQEMGKVATSAIDALRGNPGLLVLVLLQAATLLALFFVNDRNNDRRARREEMMIERCFPHTDKTKANTVVRDKVGPKGVKPQ